MATLIKTPHGSWKAVVRKQGWPTVCKTFRTKRDAEDWSRRLEDEMVRGVYIQRTQSARMLFTDALDRYLAEITPTKKLSTQRPERVKAETLRLFFGRYAMSSINIELANKYRDRRIAEGKKPNTVRLELALASHLFNTAMREWRIGLPQNPFAGMRKPSVGPGRDRRLSLDEEQKLRSKVASHSNPMMRWIFEIAIETCMRVSEITGLTPSHVDLNRRIVRLGDTKNGEARTVPLTQHAKAMFAVAIANPARPRDCNLIFAGEPGRDGIRRPYQFNKIWSRIKASLGIKDLRFHDLRHEAVSRLVEAGLSDQEVSAISGHKTMQMLKRYTHLRAEDLVEKLDRVPNNTGTA